MALSAIEKAIVEKNLSKKDTLVICTDKKEISNVIGQGRKNK